MAVDTAPLPLELRPHALYRFWAHDGTLLYIGITATLPSRLGNHSDDKPWWTEVARITVEHYTTRAKVLEAEKAAIIAERPLYNQHHNIRAKGERRTFEDLAMDVLDLLDEKERTLLWDSTPVNVDLGFGAERDRVVRAGFKAAAILYYQVRMLKISIRDLVDHAPNDVLIASEREIDPEYEAPPDVFELGDVDALLHAARRVIQVLNRRRWPEGHGWPDDDLLDPSRVFADPDLPYGEFPPLPTQRVMPPSQYTRADSAAVPSSRRATDDEMAARIRVALGVLSKGDQRALTESCVLDPHGEPQPSYEQLIDTACLAIHWLGSTLQGINQTVHTLLAALPDSQRGHLDGTVAAYFHLNEIHPFLSVDRASYLLSVAIACGYKLDPNASVGRSS